MIGCFGYVLSSAYLDSGLAPDFGLGIVGLSSLSFLDITLEFLEFEVLESALDLGFFLELIAPLKLELVFGLKVSSSYCLS